MEQIYSSAWQHWLPYCIRVGIPQHSPAVNQVLDYLPSLYESGLSYRTINCYRSTLSTTLLLIDNYDGGKHPLVTRLMRGIYNSRPPVKTLVPTWSVMTVLKMLKLWSPNDKLDLKRLTYKTVMLLTLVTARRCSSLYLLTLKERESTIKFQPFGLEKNLMMVMLHLQLKLNNSKIWI